MSRESNPPKVGEVWIADLRGKVRFAGDLAKAADSIQVRGPVLLTWVSKDDRVFSGAAWHKRMVEEVTLARTHLIERAPRAVAEAVPTTARFTGKA